MRLKQISKWFRKDRDEPDEVKRRTAESIWGPRGHFTIFQQDNDDVWSIAGTLTDKPDAKIYSGAHTPRDQAIEHAKVLAGIAPFGPEGVCADEITPTYPVPNRRAAIAHTKALA